MSWEISIEMSWSITQRGEEAAVTLWEDSTSLHLVTHGSCGGEEAFLRTCLPSFTDHIFWWSLRGFKAEHLLSEQCSHSHITNRELCGDVERQWNIYLTLAEKVKLWLLNKKELNILSRHSIPRCRRSCVPVVEEANYAFTTQTRWRVKQLERNQMMVRLRDQWTSAPSASMSTHHSQKGLSAPQIHTLRFSFNK